VIHGTPGQVARERRQRTRSENHSGYRETAWKIIGILSKVKSHCPCHRLAMWLYSGYENGDLNSQ
jgi:hypothetical protein